MQKRILKGSYIQTINNTYLVPHYAIYITIPSSFSTLPARLCLATYLLHLPPSRPLEEQSHVLETMEEMLPVVVASTVQDIHKMEEDKDTWLAADNIVVAAAPVDFVLAVALLLLLHPTTFEQL